MLLELKMLPESLAGMIEDFVLPIALGITTYWYSISAKFCGLEFSRRISPVANLVSLFIAERVTEGEQAAFNHWLTRCKSPVLASR